jgi:hypothetical protein
LAAWTLEALPAGRTVTGVVMLGAALSSGYPLGPALAKVEEEIWNFWSPLDLVLLVAGTLLFGTVDGQHAVSAGLCGFSMPEYIGAAERELYQSRLRQRGYDPRMVSQFHLGGHFGWANRVLVAESVTPLLLGEDEQAVSAR